MATIPDTSEARQAILQRIKAALVNKSEEPSPPTDLPIYAEGLPDVVEEFAQQFLAKSGGLYFANSPAEALHLIEAFLAERGIKDLRVWEKDLQLMLGQSINYIDNDVDFHLCEAGLTLVEALVARTGSLVVSSRQGSGRRLNIYPPLHMVLAFTSQIKPDVADGLNFVRNKYGNKMPSLVSLVSGASRTADIEKTLVMGAHGPRELVLFLVDDLET